MVRKKRFSNEKEFIWAMKIMENFIEVYVEIENGVYLYPS